MSFKKKREQSRRVSPVLKTLAPRGSSENTKLSVCSLSSERMNILEEKKHLKKNCQHAPGGGEANTKSLFSLNFRLKKNLYRHRLQKKKERSEEGTLTRIVMYLGRKANRKTQRGNMLHTKCVSAMIRTISPGKKHQRRSGGARQWQERRKLTKKGQLPEIIGHTSKTEKLERNRKSSPPLSSSRRDRPPY